MPRTHIFAISSIAKRSRASSDGLMSADILGGQTVLLGKQAAPARVLGPSARMPSARIQPLCQLAGVCQREMSDRGGRGDRMASTTIPNAAIVLMVCAFSITAGCSSPQLSNTTGHTAFVTTSAATVVPPPTSPPTTAPPTTQPVVASTRCQSSQLRLGVGPPVSEETGEHSLLLILTNAGSDACYLYGYPGVTLYDAQNALLPLSYERSGYQSAGPAPQRVDLAPGSTAFVMISKYRCDLGDKTTAETLRLIPPDDTTSMSVSIEGLRDLSYCGPGDPGSTLDTSPVEPTASATTAF